MGSSPIKLVLGEKIRLGNVFGSTGPFFYSQAFALGGVQYGEQLRGYPEFSITPAGYLTGTSTFNATPTSFGNTVLTTTTEMGLRLNSSIYLDLFLDAGNLWAGLWEFDPTLAVSRRRRRNLGRYPARAAGARRGLWIR